MKVEKSLKIAVVAASLAILVGCAEKKTRLWIEPPPGSEYSERSAQKIYYQVEDVQSGKKENLVIPLQQMPENLVVEQKSGDRGEDGSAAATQADREIAQGKLSESGKTDKPTVSYLRGLAEVESLYQNRKYSEALVRLSPLIAQYPRQARLYTMQGTLFRRIGEKKLALDAYKRARNLDQRDSVLEDAVLQTQDEAGENL